MISPLRPGLVEVGPFLGPLWYGRIGAELGQQLQELRRCSLQRLWLWSNSTSRQPLFLYDKLSDTAELCNLRR